MSRSPTSRRARPSSTATMLGGMRLSPREPVSISATWRMSRSIPRPRARPSSIETECGRTRRSRVVAVVDMSDTPRQPRPPGLSTSTASRTSTRRMSPPPRPASCGTRSWGHGISTGTYTPTDGCPQEGPEAVEAVAVASHPSMHSTRSCLRPVRPPTRCSISTGRNGRRPP